MAFQLSSINEVITPEVFESLKATIEAKKNQKAPSAALPRRAPASVPAEQLKLINELLDTSYENSDWLVYAQSSQGLDGMGISRSELLSVRIATSVALSLAEDSQTADALAALITWINKHPTFGDLYLGLAGLKLRASQIDAARQLVELAELCPRYHKNGVANMKKKIELLLPEWRTSVCSWVVRYADPDKSEIINLGIDAEIIAKAMPAIEAIRADPSNAFTVWQHSPEFREWADKADDNAAKARVVYPYVKVPQENPLVSLNPKITTNILNYLEMSSILNLRATCVELCAEVSYSQFWKGYIDRTGIDFDKLPGYMTEVPMAVFSGLRSVLKMVKLISGESETGPLDMTTFSTFALSAADEILEVVKGLSAGASWHDLTSCLFAYRLQALACIDPSGRFLEYLEDHAPHIIHTLFRLMRSPNPIVVTCALQLILFTIVTKSSRRMKWVAQYRHWRLTQHLTRFGLFRQNPFSQISSMINAALEAADFMDPEHHKHDLRMDAASPKLEKAFESADFDGLWWIAQVGAQVVGVEGVFQLVCCDLKWVKKEDKVTIEGPAFFSQPSNNLVEATIDGSASLALDQIGFQFSVNDGSFSIIHDGVLIPVGIGGTASRPEDLAEGGGAWNPAVSFFMWRDTRPSTPELLEEAKAKVRIASAAGSPPDWFDEERNMEANRPMMAARLANGFAHTAGHFATWTVVEQASVPYEIPGLNEYAADPSIPPVVLDTLAQAEDEESDEAFSTRQNLFLGATSILVVERLNIIPSFADEMDADLAIFTSAAKQVYSVLPEDVLIAGGVLDPQAGGDFANRRALAQALVAKPKYVMLMICQRQLLLWSKPETQPRFLAAISQIVDAILRTAVTNPTNTVIDFDQTTPINTIYRKWTNRLSYTHPGIASASLPFTFEELCASFYICQQRINDEIQQQLEQDEANADPNGHMNAEDSQQIFSDALKRKSRKTSDSSSMVTSALIIAGATVATLAIGVGAFLLGRRLTNQD